MKTPHRHGEMRQVDRVSRYELEPQAVQYLYTHLCSSFQNIYSVITKIREAFGSPSISCGVMHKGETVFLHGDGLAEVENHVVPDANTVYAIASVTKGFITALCGILVEEGKLSWNEPVSTYLPGFKTVHDPEIGKRATLLDLCSHGTGLAPMDKAGCAFFDEFVNTGNDGVEIAANLPVCYDFRSHWLYNNFTLGVVGELIGKITGKSSGTVLREKIFEPLGMDRSSTRTAEHPTDGNVARGYAVLDDGSLLPLDQSVLEDGGLQGASGYVRSSVKDMLTWAKAVMEAEKDERCPNTAGWRPKKPNPLRKMQLTRCIHRPITLDGSRYENSYGLGWFRHMLPSSYLGSIGPNFALLPDPPIINQAGPPRLTVAHYGEFGGFMCAFYTFPDTCSSVVVMTNCSPGRGDPSDLIAQSLIQELFDMRPHVALEDYALTAARTSRLMWTALVEEWVHNRIQNTKLPPLEDFIGTYVCTGLKLTLYVSKLSEKDIGRGPSPELLKFNINSLPRQTAKLRHYHYDTWTFLPDSRDDAVKKGMESYLRLPLLLLSFMRDDLGNVSGLEWDLQAGACEGPAPGLDKAVRPVLFTKTNRP